MKLFYPTWDFLRITDIPVNFFEDNNIKGVILDVDNTLTTHDNPKPLDNLDFWLEEVKNRGVKLIIVSNNNSERVTPFAKLLDIDFVADGKKPLSSGLKRAANVLKLEKKQIVVIGDQIFTDILGGNLWGCPTILVSPIELEEKPFFKLKRRMEKVVLKKYKNY